MFAWQNADDKVKSAIPTHQGGPESRKWFVFPFNYDPVWGPDECPARAETAKPEVVEKPDPIHDLISLLR
jgi:hypothetical protein